MILSVYTAFWVKSELSIWFVRFNVWYGTELVGKYEMNYVYVDQCGIFELSTHKTVFWVGVHSFVISID